MSVATEIVLHMNSATEVDMSESSSEQSKADKKRYALCAILPRCGH